MNKFEKKYPKIFKTLTDAGVGKRKARRMIRLAVFKNGHKHTGDMRAPNGFCVWSQQGEVFRKTWMDANDAYYSE